MKKYVFLFFAAAMLTFAACNSNNEPNVSGVQLPVTPSDEEIYEPTEEPSQEENSGVFHHFYTLGFSVEFPAFWEGKYGWEYLTIELEHGTRDLVGIYHIATREEMMELFNHAGGHILTLGRSPGEHYTYDNAPIMAGGSIFLAQTDGFTYFVNFPSGIEHNYDDPNSTAAAEYMEMIGHWEPSHWDFLTNSFMLINSVATNLNQPTDAEIEALYQRAVEAFEWFHMTTMPLNTAYEAADENGIAHWRVDFEGISTLADLEAYLGSIFAAEIVNELLTDSRYREFDGILYAIGADRGSDLTRGDEVHEIIRTTREHHGYDFMIYRVMVDILDADNLEEVVGFELYDFSLTRVDGNWMFINFNLVR